MSEVLYLYQTFTDCVPDQYIHFDMLCMIYYVTDVTTCNGRFTGKIESIGYFSF